MTLTQKKKKTEYRFLKIITYKIGMHLRCFFLIQIQYSVKRSRSERKIWRGRIESEIVLYKSRIHDLRSNEHNPYIGDDDPRGERG